MRRHIAGRAGIAIGLPDTANALISFKNSEVCNTRLKQFNGGADTAKAATDNSCRDFSFAVFAHYYRPPTRKYRSTLDETMRIV